MREKLEILPRGSFTERCDSLMVLSADLLILKPHYLLPPIEATAWGMAKEGDREGFVELEKDVVAMLRALASDDPTTMLEGVLTLGICSSISEKFEGFAHDLGLSDSAARWNALALAVKDARDSGKGTAIQVDGKTVEPALVAAGSATTALELSPRLLREPIRFSQSDLNPGRLAEHEYLGRAAGFAIWLLLGVSLGLAAMERLRVSALVRRLVNKMDPLVTAGDWGWVLVVGILLPLCYVLGINRLTPLGGRHLSLSATEFLLPLSQFLGLWVLWLVVPALVIRWRVSKRLAFLQTKKIRWADWAALGTAFAFPPVIGWAVLQGSAGPVWRSSLMELGLEPFELRPVSPWFWIALTLLAIPVLWIFGRGFGAIMGHRDLPAALASRMTRRAMGVAMFCIVPLAVGLRWSEERWFRSDPLFGSDPNASSWSPFEFRVATEMRKELREMLAPFPR